MTDLELNKEIKFDNSELQNIYQEVEDKRTFKDTIEKINLAAQDVKNLEELFKQSAVFTRTTYGPITINGIKYYLLWNKFKSADNSDKSWRIMVEVGSERRNLLECPTGLRMAMMQHLPGFFRGVISEFNNVMNNINPKQEESLSAKAEFNDDPFWENINR